MSRIKSLLPKGPSPRRLPSGIGRGLIMHIDFAHQTGLYFGLYERELNPHLRRLARPGAPSFDVGANVGYDALVLAKLTGAPVVSFEADRDIAERLHENLQLNPDLAPRIKPVVAMVGDTSDAGAGHVTLDEVAYDGGPVPGFVKIDVEGAEAQVLAGAQRLLGEARPGLIIETHSVEADEACQSALAAQRYRIDIVEPRTWLADHRPLDHNRWLVCTPA